MNWEKIPYIELMGFGASGWGFSLLWAAGVTITVALSGFLIGTLIGTGICAAKTRGNAAAYFFAYVYTTVLRGIPDLLVIYLFYFGGSAALTALASLFGAKGFVGVPAFASGACAIGVISGAYQAEVFRGAFNSIATGELEAARATGMRGLIMLRRIIAPQVLRYAIPNMGNLWQLALKESALISVTGLVELLRQAQIAAGATYRPFDFYITALGLYLIITSMSGFLFQRAEEYTIRSMGGKP